MIASIEALVSAFSTYGVKRIFAKPLVENDNQKQQIYVGGSFEVLKDIPFQAISPGKIAKRQNFKAKLDFYWLLDTGKTQGAPHAQLILYPDYPEVRLSGFLKGCSGAPAKHLRPIPKEQRKQNKNWDGRVLFLGITDDNKILSYLGLTNSAISQEFDVVRLSGKFSARGVFWDIPIQANVDSRTLLLEKLAEIKNAGWHQSIRLDAKGNIKPYQARNGGGYTLEALFGIIPNGKSEPDYLGWELKAYSSDRITLMTPEPDGGFYGDQGAAAFVRRYGHDSGNDVLYFTGVHRVGHTNEKTGHTLVLRGFDAEKSRIIDVNGGIDLLDKDGTPSAIWSFSGLIDHWSRKHASAAYIPYEKRETDGIEYRYNSPALLGQDTDFCFYLTAMQCGSVIYDPAPKLTDASTPKSKIKARSQFRISVKKLASLYDTFETVVF